MVIQENSKICVCNLCGDSATIKSYVDTDTGEEAVEPNAPKFLEYPCPGIDALNRTKTLCPSCLAMIQAVTMKTIEDIGLIRYVKKQEK